MWMRVIVVVVSLWFVFNPGVVTAQTFEPARFSLQAAGGTTLRSGGSVVSGAFGFSPVSRLELLVTAERTHLPFETKSFPDGGVSRTRGGTMTFVSGEMRVALMPVDRVSPYALAGIGGGVARPNVNTQFPDAVTNDLRVVYFGGGVRVPLGRNFSLMGDVRAMLALEEPDGIMAVLPVRAGIAWRF